MAEEEGFEPSVQVSSHGQLATPCISINISINKDPQKKQINYIDWIELIKFKETRNYVQRVLENYNVYRYVLEQKPIKMKDFFKSDPLF